jgi:hypothetical protein
MSTNTASIYLYDTKDTEVTFTSDLCDKLNVELHKMTADMIPEQHVDIVKDHLSIVLLLKNYLPEHAQGLARLWEELEGAQIETEQYG